MACCEGSLTGAEGLVSPNGQDLLVPGRPLGDITGSTRWYRVQLSDGSTTEVVPPGGMAPSWSADGKSIVYAQLVGAGANLVVHNLATGDESLVRPLPARFTEGVWLRH